MIGRHIAKRENAVKKNFAAERLSESWLPNYENEKKAEPASRFVPPLKMFLMIFSLTR